MAITDNLPHVLAAVDKAGVVDTVVSALKHESPYCVGAAAACLALIAHVEGAGHAMLLESGAIPALVRVIERAIPPAEAKETGLYHRCVHGK